MNSDQSPDSPSYEPSYATQTVTNVVGLQPVDQPPAVEPSVVTPAVEPTAGQNAQLTAAATDPAVVSGTQQVPMAAPVKAQNNPGVIVLQWLTYAFWGWTIISVISLTASVLDQFISKSDSSTFTIYALAASLVLLPISVVCDIFYSKKEPTKKTGAASVVMIIHAVIFALCGIGSLIGMVFAFLNIATASGGSINAEEVWILTLLIAAAIYALLFVRTLLGPKLPLLRRLTPIIMVGVVGILAIAAFAGPIASQARMRHDKLLSTSLSSVAEEVSGYASNHGSLPDSLDQLGLVGYDKILVDSQKITYTKKEQSSATGYSMRFSYDYGTSQQSYSFELCGVYEHDYQTSDITASKGGYANNFYVSGHKSGKQCYELKTGY